MPDLAPNTELLVREVEQLRITITALQKALIRNDSEFMDIEQASLLLGYSKSHIYKLTSKNKIPHFKMGKHLRFVRSELESWVRRYHI